MNGTALLASGRAAAQFKALTMTGTIPRIFEQETWPSAPKSLQDLRLPRPVIHDLVLRYLWLHGSATLISLHKALKLPFVVLESIFQELRKQQFIEVKLATGHDFTFCLTATGRTQASARMDACRYVGPAPVSLGDYERIVRSQAAEVELSRDQLKDAFHDLVLPDALLDKLGPALIAHRSLFLYGDTGSGKTSIAQRILRIYEDPVLIPYALEIDGQIVSVLDSQVHRLVKFSGDGLDPRWEVCQRHCVKVGGELTAAMLELRRDEATGVFIAPSQLKANNGVLIIDDFGRQIISPRELLNRWIVPLDQRVDFLGLPSGAKFQVPFELMLVFSTNLDPNELVDDAFLRRIQTKVAVQDVGPEIFTRIFQGVVETEGIPCEPDCAAHLIECCRSVGAKVLRACYPTDIVRLIKAISKYEGHPVRITSAKIDRAVDLYFARSPSKPNPQS